MHRYIIAVLSTLALTLGAGYAKSAPQKNRLSRVQDLSRHVGEYPCNTGLLKAPVFLAALRSVLHRDYNAYRNHMSASGCGAIERHGEYVVLDVSQLHVGGYTSVIVVRETDGVLFLVWLKSEVAKRVIQVYGPTPIPSEVKGLFVHSLNVAWGHVACFAAEGDKITIDTTRRANQDKGECLPQ